MSLNDINNLSHAKWNYKYHIVFAPRYRRKVFYKEKRAASNNPRAAGRPYYTFTRCARNRGLRPHRKAPSFTWGGPYIAVNLPKTANSLRRGKDNRQWQSDCHHKLERGRWKDNHRREPRRWSGAVSLVWKTGYSILLAVNVF